MLWYAVWFSFFFFLCATYIKNAFTHKVFSVEIGVAADILRRLSLNPPSLQFRPNVWPVGWVHQDLPSGQSLMLLIHPRLGHLHRNHLGDNRGDSFAKWMWITLSNIATGLWSFTPLTFIELTVEINVGVACFHILEERPLLATLIRL